MPAVVLAEADANAPRAGLLAERIEALRGRVRASIDLSAMDGTDPYTVQRLQSYLGAG